MEFKPTLTDVESITVARHGNDVGPARSAAVNGSTRLESETSERSRDRPFVSEGPDFESKCRANRLDILAIQLLEDRRLASVVEPTTDDERRQHPGRALEA